jgi:hypothetical protein
MLHNWEASGYEVAQNKFLECYHPSKNVLGEHHIENIICDKLDYLKMVKGQNDSTYLKLRERLDRLVKLNQSKVATPQSIEIHDADITMFEKDDVINLELMNPEEEKPVAQNLLDDMLQRLCDSGFDLTVL